MHAYIHTYIWQIREIIKNSSNILFNCVFSDYYLFLRLIDRLIYDYCTFEVIRKKKKNIRSVIAYKNSI